MRGTAGRVLAQARGATPLRDQPDRGHPGRGAAPGMRGTTRRVLEVADGRSMVRNGTSARAVRVSLCRGDHDVPHLRRLAGRPGRRGTGAQQNGGADRPERGDRHSGAGQRLVLHSDELSVSVRC